jgi:hypothetical protein
LARAPGELRAWNSLVANAARRVSIAALTVGKSARDLPDYHHHKERKNFGDIDRLPENMERMPRIQLEIG